MAGTIVHQSENTQVVQLSSEFHPEYYDGSIALLFGTISSTSVQLCRMNNDEETQKFMLSEDEMDTLCEAWTAFKAAQEAKAEVERQRQQEMIKEAYALAERCPEIKIIEKPDFYGPGKMAWDVSLPALARSYYSYVDDPDDLLERVKSCAQTWEKHQAMLAEAQADKEGAF